uniref:NADH dehydrogenase subunit 6 n=1 Tax=Janus sp. TaxID=3003420 RepID=A0A9E9BXJ7_9HYME|nr:NADH dehydrogenase subunit 6 [Janus sp.]
MSMNIFSFTITGMQMTLKIFTSFMIITLLTIMLITKFNNPLSLMILLILVSLFVTLKISVLYKNFWFSYMLLLTMIGGILILFLYFVSVCSNEYMKLFKYSYTMIININLSILLIMSLLYYFYMEPFFFIYEENLIKTHSFLMENWSSKLPYNSHQMFNLTSSLSILIMAYLMFVLFSLVKICMKFYGPLRQFF